MKQIPLIHIKFVFDGWITPKFNHLHREKILLGIIEHSNTVSNVMKKYKGDV